MTETQNDLEELKNLQREAAAGRAEREQQRSTANERDPAVAAPATKMPKSTETPPPAEAAAPADTLIQPATAADEAVEDFANQIGGFVKDMEEAASERPVLALLAAFSVGVIVGQLFSRR